jgi:hypothetical protein
MGRIYDICKVFIPLIHFSFHPISLQGRIHLKKKNIHIFCFVKIRLKRTCEHAHVQLVKNSAQHMVSTIKEKGSLLVYYNILQLCLSFQANDIVLPFQEGWPIQSRA